MTTNQQKETMSEIICKQAMEAWIKNNSSCEFNWFAEACWKAAEQAMQKKSIQKPVLEQSIKDAVEVPVKLCNVLLEILEFTDLQFTQQELQFLKVFLQEEIRIESCYKAFTKKQAAQKYNALDNNPSLFKAMNKQRDDARKSRARIEKLATIQRKIKKQLARG